MGLEVKLFVTGSMLILVAAAIGIFFENKPNNIIAIPIVGICFIGTVMMLFGLCLMVFAMWL